MADKKNNTGIENSGNWNSGNGNSGYGNSGNSNGIKLKATIARSKERK